MQACSDRRHCNYSSLITVAFILAFGHNCLKCADLHIRGAEVELGLCRGLPSQPPAMLVQASLNLLIYCRRFTGPRGGEDEEERVGDAGKERR